MPPLNEFRSIKEIIYKLHLAFKSAYCVTAWYQTMLVVRALVPLGTIAKGYGGKVNADSAWSTSSESTLPAGRPSCPIK